MKVKLTREWMGYPKDKELVIQNHLGNSLVKRGGAVDLSEKQESREKPVAEPKMVRRPVRDKMVHSSESK